MYEVPHKWISGRMGEIYSVEQSEVVGDLLLEDESLERFFESGSCTIVALSTISISDDQICCFFFIVKT